MKTNPYDYANKLERWAMLKEVALLKALLPDTEAVRLNVRRMDEQLPLEKMNREQLRDWVNLLARSVSDEDFDARVKEFTMGTLGATKEQIVAK